MMKFGFSVEKLRQYFKLILNKLSNHIYIFKNTSLLSKAIFNNVHFCLDTKTNQKSQDNL